MVHVVPVCMVYVCMHMSAVHDCWMVEEYMFEAPWHIVVTCHIHTIDMLSIHFTGVKFTAMEYVSVCHSGSLFVLFSNALLYKL